MPKWEYLVEGVSRYYQGQGIGIVKTNAMSPIDHVQAFLNARGEEGWELVQLSPAAGQVACSIYEPGVIFVFKRLKL
jgi:hypothetical protein